MSILMHCGFVGFLACQVLLLCTVGIAWLIVRRTLRGEASKRLWRLLALCLAPAVIGLVATSILRISYNPYSRANEFLPPNYAATMNSYAWIGALGTVFLWLGAAYAALARSGPARNADSSSNRTNGHSAMDTVGHDVAWLRFSLKFWGTVSFVLGYFGFGLELMLILSGAYDTDYVVAHYVFLTCSFLLMIFGVVAWRHAPCRSAGRVLFAIAATLLIPGVIVLLRFGVLWGAIISGAAWVVAYDAGKAWRLAR